jgi:hypothetical protein
MYTMEPVEAILMFFTMIISGLLWCVLHWYPWVKRPGEMGLIILTIIAAAVEYGRLLSGEADVQLRGRASSRKPVGFKA